MGISDYYKNDREMEQTLFKELIFQLEERLMSYGYKELDELLAEDFLEFGSSGNTYDKKAQLEAVKSKKTTNTIRFTISDFNIKLLSPDVILATYRIFRHSDSKYSLRSSIWKLNEGTWQMIFHQGTPTT